MDREELLEAASWVLRQALEAEEAEDGPPEGDRWELLEGVVGIREDRLRLIFAGEEEPTLSEVADLLNTLDLGWGDFGRGLRRWQRSQNGAPYLGTAQFAVELGALQRRIEERLQSMESRLRRLEGNRDAAGK